MLDFSRKQSAGVSEARSGHYRRESRKHHDPPRKSVSFTAVEAEGIKVRLEDLQATFENLVSVISAGEEASFSKETVKEMVESIYEWMVFDSNAQIVIPSTPEATTTRKMWPHGSRIDTRKKKDPSSMEPSSRRLKSVDKDCAQTVASSVVSSTRGEEGTEMKTGSVTYSEPVHPRPRPLNHSRRLALQQYDRAPSFPAYPAYPAYDPGYERALHGLQDAVQHTVPQMIPQVPLDSHRSGAGQSRAVPRYSIVGGAVEPPERVEETPQPVHSEAVRKRVVKKTRVGASARPEGPVEGGTPVVWED
jgi:hypothetical protein